MNLHFLGTSSGAPTRERNVTAVALRLGKHYYLFDCGEATQHQLARAGISVQKIQTICISHLHGDHIYGLPGLLGSMSLQGRRKTLQIVGPVGIKAYVEQVLALSFSHLTYDIAFTELTETSDVTLVPITGRYQLYTVSLVHRVPAFGYKIVAPEQTGLFDIARADQLGVPKDSSRSRLCQGQAISLANGDTITPEQVLGPPRPGKSVAICTDTGLCEQSAALAQGVDVLVHECTYAEAERSLATRGGHATTIDAATVAKQAGAQHLILTHFSARYGKVESLKQEAETVFTPVLMAEDFMMVEI